MNPVSDKVVQIIKNALLKTKSMIPKTHSRQIYLRFPLFAAEAASPVTEASDAVFDGTFLVEAKIWSNLLLVLVLIRVLVQILAHGVGFGPSTWQGV